MVMITHLLSPFIQKVGSGSISLGIQTCCTCVPQELLQIMLQLVNIVLDSSPKNPSLVHVENIQSKQEIIFWMVANSLKITRTPKGNH